MAGRFLIFLALLVSLALVANRIPLYPLLKGSGNSMGVLNYLAMSAVIFSAAFTKPDLADRVLKRNDISYGVYIIHMPVINGLLHYEFDGVGGFISAVIVTLALATLSWRLIEKPSLRMKPRSLYAHG